MHLGKLRPDGREAQGPSQGTGAQWEVGLALQELSQHRMSWKACPGSAGQSHGRQWRGGG